MTMIPPKIKKLPGLRKKEPGYISKNPEVKFPKDRYTREKMVR